MKILKFLSIVVLLQLGHSHVAVAENSRLSSGKIDGFKIGSLNIVIDDQLYKLAHNVRVLNERNRQVSHGALTRGRIIQFRSHWVEGQRADVITEVYLSRPST